LLKTTAIYIRTVFRLHPAAESNYCFVFIFKGKNGGARRATRKKTVQLALTKILIKNQNIMHNIDRVC